jgi:hypothetical protein
VSGGDPSLTCLGSIVQAIAWIGLHHTLSGRTLAGMARKHYTVAEVAEMFATDAQQVRRWIRSGRIHAIDISTPGAGRVVYRIPASEIERLEQEMATKAAS